MIGFAARPGTAVLPTWWTAYVKRSPSTDRIAAASASNRAGHDGSWGMNLHGVVLVSVAPALAIVRDSSGHDALASCERAAAPTGATRFARFPTRLVHAPYRRRTSATNVAFARRGDPNGSGISSPHSRPSLASAHRAPALVWKCRKGLRPR
jgi:hypothetical protein